MLIRNLYNLFCGSESQDGRLVCAPDVIDKSTQVIIPEKFKDDIQKLQDYCGVELRSGLCIEIELSELLEILPREHRRKDAYDKLVKFLAEEKYPEFMIEKTADKIEFFSPVVAEVFDNWSKNKSQPDISIEGFAFKDLITKWDMNPVGAFITLDWLLREPEKAKRALNKGIK